MACVVRGTPGALCPPAELDRSEPDCAACRWRRCKEQTTACFSNPACLKGITCLGNCRGEQLCATQCFARFGSEKLNDWCALHRVFGGAGPTTTPVSLPNDTATWVAVQAAPLRWPCASGLLKSICRSSGSRAHWRSTSVSPPVSNRTPQPSTRMTCRRRFRTSSHLTLKVGGTRYVRSKPEVH